MSNQFIRECPFCTGTDLEKQIQMPQKEGVPTNIVCTNCGASGPVVPMKDDIDDLALVAAHTGWNTRRFE